MTAPQGATAADIEVREAQARLKANPVPEAWLQLAESWLRRGRISGDRADLQAAEAAAVKAEELGAKNASGVRAMALLNISEFADARALAQATLEKDPEDLRSLSVLADASLEMGQLEEAGTAVQKMVDLKPNLPSYSRASWLRWLTGDVKGAKELIRHALDAGRDPRDAEARAWTLCQAASYFWHEGDFEGAEAGYEQALSVVPDYPPALVGKARCALARGEVSRAAPLVRSAFAKRPNVETGILLAQVLEALSDPGAAASWKAAAEAGSGNPIALGWFRALRNQEIEQARTELQQASLKRPGLYVLDAYGWALFRAGRLEEAEEAIAGANRFHTRDSRLLYHWGAVLLARGQKERGRELVAEALKLNPAWDVGEVADARRLIAGP